MDIYLLSQMESTQKEIKELHRRLEELYNKENETVSDSVMASSRSFPYTQHSVSVSGVDWRPGKLRRKVRKTLKTKKCKLLKLINQLEYELNYIEDSELRRIIRYKYIDGYNWVQIMFNMEYSSESTARMKLNRFLKKIKKI